MLCKNCRHELMENEKFCPQCGQAVTPVETTISEADSPIETPVEKASSEETTKTAGDKKAQSVQWDTVKKNLQQGADKAAPILKAGFGKAREFTAQTVHEFKDAATEVKGAGVSGASVAVAAKKINWKRLIPVGVALVLLIFVVKACGGGGKTNPIFEEYMGSNGKVDYCAFVKEQSLVEYPGAPLGKLLRIVNTHAVPSWETIEVSETTIKVSASVGGCKYIFAFSTKTGLVDLVDYMEGGKSYAGPLLDPITKPLLDNAYSLYDSYVEAGLLK